MAVEVPAEYGGSEASFTAAIIAIEELAKVDPSISVMCDVHVLASFERSKRVRIR
jgi:short-chain 2-methylacyl-CoA dehydrogenase